MQNKRITHLSEDFPLKRETLAELLQALRDPATSPLEADALSHAVLRCLREIMVADMLVILLLTEDHTALRIHIVLGSEETVVSEVRIPLGTGFAGQIVAQGLPLIVHDSSTVECFASILLHESPPSILGVPLIVHKQVIGVMHVGMKQGYVFTDSDVALVLHVANCLAQTFAHTLLIKAGPHMAEELIDAQLCAIVELVESQLHLAVGLVESQLHLAVGLVESQQRVAIELVGLQLQAAIDLVGVRLRAAVELVEAQQHIAVDLVDAQQHIAVDLVEVQQQVAIELVEAQLPTAENLMEAQQQVARKLVKVQLPTGGEFIEIQQQVAEELVEAQQQVAEELVEAQEQTAGKLIEAQEQTAGKLIEAQEQTAGNLADTQQQIAEDLVDAQIHLTKDLVDAQQQVAIALVEEQQRVAIALIEAQQQERTKAFGRINELEMIFNAITDAVIVYSPREQMLRSNRAAHHLSDAYGYPFSPEPLLVKRLLDGERLAAKQAITVHLHTLDDCDAQLSVIGAPFYNQEGELCGAVCVLRDVTTRKHMERRIEILETLLQMVELLVTSSAPKEQMVKDDPALVTQQVESASLALAQRLLGCSHAIIMGIHQSTHVLSSLALAGFSAEQEQHLRAGITGAHLSLLLEDPSTLALLEKQEHLPFDITQSPLLRSLFPMSSAPNCYLIPIYLAHQLIGLLGIAFPESASGQYAGDGALITAISRLCALTLQYRQQIIDRDQLMAATIVVNEQLEQVNKMQNDFISVVSHEFRTALSTIEGFSDLLRSENFPDEEVKEYANDIYTDAVRLHQMVTDLLDVEQMKGGQMQMHVIQIDMNMLLTTLVKHLEPVVTNHRLCLSLQGELPLLEGNEEKLLQVFTNILSNAMKYSPRGGDILITSGKEGNAIHVSIQDHGIGIASKDLENIFTSYHRIHSSATRYIQGTGLGLSMAYEIIRLHEGKIWIESTLGHGSTFHLSLPLTREE